MSKYTAIPTSKFKKDLKRVIKRGYNINLLMPVINTLLDGNPLPQAHHDHALSGAWKGYRECHITNDWLLIYQAVSDTLILLLMRTGTHSDLFEE